VGGQSWDLGVTLSEADGSGGIYICHYSKPRPDMRLIGRLISTMGQTMLITLIACVNPLTRLIALTTQLLGIFRIN
jgi:hypothetical protein